MASEAAIEARRKYAREYGQKWRKENREKYNESQREWRKNNKEKVKVYHERYWEKKATEM